MGSAAEDGVQARIKNTKRYKKITHQPRAFTFFA